MVLRLLLSTAVGINLVLTLHLLRSLSVIQMLLEGGCMK